MKFGEKSIKRFVPIFSDKIVEIASKRKIRRVATANAPPRAFVQNDEKIPLALCQRDSIGFANGNCYHVGLFLTEKSVVPDKSPNSHILPSCPVCVLISQSIILGKRTPPIIDKTGIFRHGKLTGFLVIPCMLCGSALQVVCCPYLQDITAFCVHIMPHIQKLFLTADSITSFWEAGQTVSRLSRLFLRFTLLHKRQLETVLTNRKGYLPFLVGNLQVYNGELTILFQKLRKLCDNAPFSCVGLSLPGRKLVGGGRFPCSRMGEFLRYFCLIRGEVILRPLSGLYGFIIGK